jgi:hypothetical protein
VTISRVDAHASEFLPSRTIRFAEKNALAEMAAKALREFGVACRYQGLDLVKNNSQVLSIGNPPFEPESKTAFKQNLSAEI